MNIYRAAELAQQLLLEYKLFDWQFRYNRKKHAFGVCHYNLKLIEMSKELVALNSEEDVRDTILHEIAHAIVGIGHGHGPAWKHTARLIGAKTAARYETGLIASVPGRWQANCPGCNTLFHKHRKPKSLTRVCLDCYNKYRRVAKDTSTLLLTWREVR